jgi:uncharacterized protein (TIRG00374 family)
VGCAISALAIVLLFQQVPPDKLAEELQRAQPLPLALMVATVVLSLIARAARWRVYFLPDRKVPFRPLLGTLSISYMASTFLPFRAGELVRAVFLGKRESLPLARIVGTILLEKLFDFLAIGVMLVLLIVTTPLPAWAAATGSSIATVILVGFGFVVVLAVWRSPTLRMVGSLERLIPFGLGERVGLTRAVAQFAAGTDSMRELRLWGPMLGWTLIAWLFSIGTGWAGGRAVGLSLGLPELTFLIVLTSTGQAVPSSPGYVGVYHYLAWLALTTFAVEPTAATAVAVLTHGFSYGTMVASGLLALWLGGYGVRDLMAGVKVRGDADWEIGRDGAEETGAFRASMQSTVPVSGTHTPTLPAPPSPAPPVPPSRRA